MKILSINPGSTSTKIALYDDLTAVFVQTLRHSAKEIAKYSKVYDQYEFRKNLIVKILKDNNVELSSLDAVIGRGGLLKPIPGGIYKVNDVMLKDLKNVGPLNEHASNLGAIIAFEIARETGKNIPSYIADPVVVDELEDVARFSGHPELLKVSIFHALNQKAIARRYCRENNLDYYKLNLIVAHLGGGISIGIHKNGKIVDVNNALNGNGPFSPERSGTLPSAALVELCFSGKYTKPEILKLITGKGGCVAFLGTNDMYEIEVRAFEKGDKEALQIIEAMVYQIAKEIGSVAPVVDGKIDAILITGGIAYGEPIMERLVKKIKFIAPVKIYPGEDEMGALAESVYYASKGEMNILEYK
jgi:butyrate kinase